MDITKEDISYRVSFSKKVRDWDGADYYTEFSGSILLYQPDASTKDIGEFCICKVALNSCFKDDDSQLFDLLDVTQTVTDVANEILNDDYEIKEHIVNDNDFPSDDFTIIDSIKIDPEYRGMNIGLVVIRDFILNYVGHGEIVAVKPSPFYCDTEGETDEEINRRRAKLRKHWAKLGFKKYKNQKYMLLKVWRGMKNINLKTPKKKLVLA